MVVGDGGGGGAPPASYGEFVRKRSSVVESNSMR